MAARYSPLAKCRMPATAYSAIASVLPKPREVVTRTSLPQRSLATDYWRPPVAGETISASVPWRAGREETASRHVSLPLRREGDRAARAFPTRWHLAPDNAPR